MRVILMVFKVQRLFFEGQDGAIEFRPLPPPTDDEVAAGVISSETGR
jgi:hypothetical protein